MAAARRAAGEIDFLVVAQHYPLYTNHATRGPFSPELRPEVVDAFTLRRKDDAVLRSAALAPRPVGELLSGVPEARGVVVRNLAEDCTRH